MQSLRCRFRTVAALAFLCLLSCSLTACGSKDGLGPVDVTAYEKVKQHAWNAMAFNFDRVSDAGTLRQFIDDSADADDRQELIRIWRAIDPLGTDHPDLLQHSVFDKAMAEPDWPSEPVDEKAVFVAGTRDATDDFLGSEYGRSDGTATVEALAALNLHTENREEALRSFVQTAATDRGHDVSSDLSDYLLVRLARALEPDSRDRAANAVANTLLLLELMIAESGESRVLTMEHLHSAIARFRLCPGFWPFC